MNLEDHARAIRQAVAGLRTHADAGIGPDDITATIETQLAARAAYVLEEAIMRTLPLRGMEPPVPTDDADYAMKGED